MENIICHLLILTSSTSVVMWSGKKMAQQPEYYSNKRLSMHNCAHMCSPPTENHHHYLIIIASSGVSANNTNYVTNMIYLTLNNIDFRLDDSFLEKNRYNSRKFNLIR